MSQPQEKKQLSSRLASMKVTCIPYVLRVPCLIFLRNPINTLFSFSSVLSHPLNFVYPKFMQRKEEAKRVQGHQAQHQQTLRNEKWSVSSQPAESTKGEPQTSVPVMPPTPSSSQTTASNESSRPMADTFPHPKRPLDAVPGLPNVRIVETAEESDNSNSLVGFQMGRKSFRNFNQNIEVGLSCVIYRLLHTFMIHLYAYIINHLVSCIHLLLFIALERGNKT